MAAHDIISRDQRQQIVCTFCIQHFARQNHGLRRLWAVDEDDALLRSRRGNIEILPALHVERHAPKTEALLEQRLQFRKARITTHKDIRIVVPNPPMMETSKIVAKQILK